MKKTIKNVVITCCILALLIVVFWIRDIISDRRNEINILKQITLLEKAPQDYPSENKKRGMVQAGEKVKVLRMGYGKDFRAWKVSTSSGQEGWFIEENDNINIKIR